MKSRFGQTAGLVLWIAAAGCSSTPALQPAWAWTVPASDPGGSDHAAPTAPPALTPEAARTRAAELVAVWRKAPRYQPVELASYLHEARLDPLELVRVVDVLTPCSADEQRLPDVCKSRLASSPDSGLFEPVVNMLAEVADPQPGATPAMRLLVRLDAHGLSTAGSAIERLLERRLLANRRQCQPPDAERIAAADAALDDFVIVRVLAPGRPSEVRPPSAAERAELAYFHAALAAAGAPVGAAHEDTIARSLPAGHPDLELRKELAARAAAALRAGDIEAHLGHAEDYLKSLGYPDPIRVAEENDERWGGAGFSYVMRDLARSAEILGRYQLAEDLYRRADPGGGMCGSSTQYRFEEQLAGVIRSAELGRGGCAAVAERLYGLAFDPRGSVGVALLERDGLDVPRLYRAALLTAGRTDRASVEWALNASATYAAPGLARLARLGPESWATRVRAIHGLADGAGAAAVDALFAIALRSDEVSRVDALDAIGRLAEDSGHDPCAPGIGEAGGGLNGEREVHSVMDTCATRLDAKASAAIALRLAPLAKDPSPRVRAAVATALGRLGSPAGSSPLQLLSRDAFDAGGQVCTTRGNEPPHCEKNLPVARAANEALHSLDTKAKRRAARP